MITINRIQFALMADGPVANMPDGMDAYAGYIDNSGIGVTYPDVVKRWPNAFHLSISIHGNPAMCADVEPGAMSGWQGYEYGYCSVSQANKLIHKFGRPKFLWTAHYTDVPHLCSPDCWPGLETVADATQFSNHGNVWDESLCSLAFIHAQPQPKPPPPALKKEVPLFLANDGTGQYIVCESAYGVVKRPLPPGSELQLLAEVIPNQPSPMPIVLSSIPNVS